MTHTWNRPTDAAQTRRQLARELLRSMDLQPNEEIVLTGSVARGVADRFSDIEIRFLVDALQPPQVYDDQLRAAGAQVEPATTYWNNTIITKSWFKGVFIEAAWQAWDGLEGGLAPLLAAETTEHWALVEAWHVLHALPLTAAPRVEQWQQRLAKYPDALQAKLIEQVIATWAQPHWYPTSPVNVWPVAQRNARMALAAKLIIEIERMLRLIFAVNKVWEPDYKWLLFVAAPLAAEAGSLGGARQRRVYKRGCGAQHRGVLWLDLGCTRACSTTTRRRAAHAACSRSVAAGQAVAQRYLTSTCFPAQGKAYMPSIFDVPELYDVVLAHAPDALVTEAASVEQLLAQRGVGRGGVLELACGA